MKRYLILLFFSATLFSCSPLKHVPEGRQLLVKNEIEIDGAKKGKAENFIRQKPNKKVIFYRFYLQLYNVSGNKDNKWNAFWRRIGEPPVVYDSLSASKSAEQIERYYQSIGYFNADCSFKSEQRKLRRRRTRVVTYSVKPGAQYMIRNVEFKSESQPIKFLLPIIEENSKVNSGNPYNSETLDDERSRISTYLRGKGYYFFTKDHVFFEVDSSLGSHQVDIKVKLQNIRYRSGDTVLQEEHHPYLINDVIIHADYNPRKPNAIPTDTTTYGGYTIVYTRPLKIKPRALTDAVIIKSGDWYSYRRSETTYNHYNALQSFRSISIQFTKDSTKIGNYLNTKILLSPVKKWSYGIETEGTNEVGNLGVSGRLIFRNKNVFGGLEQMDFSIRGALESQRSVEEETDGLFNTSEFGAEVNLRIPRFLLPFNTAGVFSKRNQPFTNINLAVIREIRPDFNRIASSASFGYIWNENVAKTHIVDVFNITGVRLDAKQSFQLSDNPFLADAFKNQLITSFKYSFLYNSQKLPKKQKERFYSYFKGSVETSGFVLHNTKETFGFEQAPSGKYQFLGLPYSHFLRTDIDYRIYFREGLKNQYAFRAFVGWGHVFDNSDVLPLEKQYFAGGSADIRAFTAYQLGPGTFQSDDIKFNTGDIKLTLSAEYRFQVFKSIYSAVFVDAGNIWTGNRDEAPEGTRFDLDTFDEQIAIGTGIGLRYDFSFFIIRLDLGIPVKDPSNIENPWVITKYQLADTKFNIGLGYPF